MKTKWFLSTALFGLISLAYSQSNGGCPACTIIQAQQRGSLQSGVTEMTVPKGQLNFFTMMSPNSEENRARVFLKTGVTDRFDVGIGHSRSGNRTNLQFTWHAIDEDRDGLPFHVLTGYGFSNTFSRDQDAFYVLAVKPLGRASLTVGFERLRNGRNLAMFAGSYLLTRNTGLMFYSHTGSMPGEPTLYNVALVHRVGAWQMGIWYFHPSRERTVGLSLSTQFNIGGTK